VATFGLICAACLALWLLHRLALWMEQRGWIFYIHKKPSPASLGSAFLQIHQLAEPQKKNVLEAKQRERAEHEDAGSPDTAGADTEDRSSN
jgi:hypothetical protein